MKDRNPGDSPEFYPQSRSPQAMRPTQTHKRQSRHKARNIVPLQQLFYLFPLGGATVFKTFPRGRREWLQIKGSSIDIRLKDITDRKSFYYM